MIAYVFLCVCVEIALKIEISFSLNVLSYVTQTWYFWPSTHVWHLLDTSNNKTSPKSMFERCPLKKRFRHNADTTLIWHRYNSVTMDTENL